jgi:fucose 4-O-acetylase-like acetyltransferase
MCKNHSIVLGLNRIVNPLFYGVATILGCIQVFLLSRIASDLILTEMVNKVVSAIAKNSLYIVFFHFLSFKIVTYVYVKILGLPQLYLASFPVLFRKGSWIAYTIIGICIPVLLGLAIHKLQTILNDTRNNRPSKTTSNERL